MDSEALVLKTAVGLAAIAAARQRRIVFKASWDKANRTQLDAFRGPGLQEGLRLLERVRAETELEVLTDVHRPEDVAAVAEVADLVQVPAFLCRQTDLIVAVASCGRPMLLKKGQFLSPGDLGFVYEKAVRSGAASVWLTERGTSFGYGDLVVDMRGLVTLRALAQRPTDGVVFDATHSLQRPGQGGETGGDRRFLGALARAAVAVGVDALFAEVHPDPEHAASDRATQLPLDAADDFVAKLSAFDEACRSTSPF